MKNYILLVFTLTFQINFGQEKNTEKEMLSNYTQYDIILNYTNDFNNDGLQDKLYVLSSKKEKDQNLINNDSISKRKAVIYLGKNNKNFVKVFDNDNTFPCRECLGKSDNFVNDLEFKNNLLSYTTSIAPFASDNYHVIHFTLKFSNNNLSIYSYRETYYKIGLDDDATIFLTNKDIPKMNFNYYNWIANKNWVDYVIISNQNVTKLNDFAHKLESINPSETIIILQKILKKFPDRIVAYLNLADSYWAIGNEELAKENYRKYIELMKSQKKDMTKIPKYFWERVK